MPGASRSVETANRSTVFREPATARRRTGVQQARAYHPSMDERLRRITSRQNPAIKELRWAFSHADRTEQGDCAVEGVRIIEEAIRAGLRFRVLVFSQSGAERLGTRLLPQISTHVETLLVSDDVFASAV